MNNNELVSIIIPCYNVEKYIKECLDSVQNQTYKNIEIIIVDDGSKDGSSKIAESYALSDNRIKLIKQKNKGLSEARNIGVKNSTGKYIIFVDSDDIISDNYVEYLYSLVKKYDSDVASCDMEHFITSPVKSTIEEKIVEYTNKKEMFKNFFLFKDIKNVSPSKIFKRNIFETLRFEGEIIYEDLHLIGNILEKTNKIVCSNQQLYYYRQREDSIMHTKFSEKNLIIYDIFHKLSKFAIKYNCWKEFSYYQLKTMIDIYKLLIFSDFNDVKLENKTRKIINTSLKDTEKKYIGKRERLLIILINMPVSIYKFAINLYHKGRRK